MTINIQELLKELASHAFAVLDTNTMSAETKSVLYQMAEEFSVLAQSHDANKQAKMIKLFIGGTICALIIDDMVYNYSSVFYPKNLTEEALKTVQKCDSAIEAMYKLGEHALSNLPNTFNENIFKVKVKIINTTEPIPFFPQLEENAEKINLLVKFCVKYAENLDQKEVTEEDLSSVDLQVSKANQPQTYALSNTSMQILGGFIAAIGVVAVAVAFVALDAATFGLAGLIVAGLGAAAILGGVGLFATGTYRNHQSTSDVVVNYSLASRPM